MLLQFDPLLRLILFSNLSRNLTDEVIDFIAAQPRICRYLHVPLQSGDDGVLEAMHRPYKSRDYVKRLQRARERIPGVALATDIIVGFPGESEAAFRRTLDVVEELQFSKLHVFRYSPRPATPAAEMRDAVTPDVKKERSKRLIDLGNDIRRRFLEGHLEARLKVLVEDERVVDDVAVCSGQTSDYVRVWFEGRGALGEMVQVLGVRVRADGIEGQRA